MIIENVKAIKLSKKDKRKHRFLANEGRKIRARSEYEDILSKYLLKNGWQLSETSKWSNNELKINDVDIYKACDEQRAFKIAFSMSVKDDMHHLLIEHGWEMSDKQCAYKKKFPDGKIVVKNLDNAWSLQMKDM